MGQSKKELILIPKSEKYIQYMLEIIMKLPRTENIVLEMNTNYQCIKC